MSTSRPAAGTFAANLNTEHPIVADAIGMWVADADADMPNLIAGGPDCDKESGPTYATTGNLGGHFAGTGSAFTVAQLASNIASYPIIIGAVFARVGSKTPSSGPETIFALGDGSAYQSTYFTLFIDDGTLATNEHICVRGRVESGQSDALMDSGASYTDGALHAAVAVLYDSSGRKGLLFLDGVKVYDNTASLDPGSFGSSSFYSWAGMLATVRNPVPTPSTFIWPASSSTSVALGFVSQTKLTDQDYIDWTADPWSITAPTGPTLVKYYPTSTKSNVGGWTDNSDGSNLAGAVNETTPNDSTYIKSGTDPNMISCELYFGDMTNPPVAGTNHTLRYHAWATGTLNCTIALVAGDDTVIKTDTHNPISTEVGHAYTMTLDGTDTTNWEAAGYDGSYFRPTAGSS